MAETINRLSSRYQPPSMFMQVSPRFSGAVGGVFSGASAFVAPQDRGRKARFAAWRSTQRGRTVTICSVLTESGCADTLPLSPTDHLGWAQRPLMPVL
ncbi:hypothetical protein [Yinghuangia soli]|uniref:Uncharacterized protein n=1 Tax=Yinghuangia soli TaxID=2908204 RepID=A0AA41TX52_9ACTN|nr:hypothetical protein [Yinghuangia soli]MCF2526483.1 hypothetical protein [Yinghuangia soli]